jgi:hypothetical protein
MNTTPTSEMALSVPVKTDFPVWRTVELGTGLKTAADFRGALNKANCGIGDWGNDILGKPAFTVASEESEVDLVMVTVAELGFGDGAKRSDIYARAIELGLEPCSNEVGPQLCLQCKDQPEKDQWLLIGMEPIVDSDGSFVVFLIGRLGDSGLWLGAGDGDAGDFWFGSRRFIFLRPRK